MSVIDLSSDTATRPTAGMLQAMIKAPLGDEQKRSDPTVNELEARVAGLLELEAALLFPTATMANQVAVAVQCADGDEIVCHESAHVYRFEGGGLARNARVQVKALSGFRGQFDEQAVAAAVNPDDPHFARTRLVVVENTSNLGGGSVWQLGPYRAVVDKSHQLGLSVHLDGARLFNAARKLGVSPASWSRHSDTTQVCFSKGLGCPWGAVLAGPRELMERARRVKQALGGALRQAGVIAGAMLYALDHHVARLDEDYVRAARLARELELDDRLAVELVETNIVYFRVRDSAKTTRFVEKLREQGISVHAVADGRIRTCTHLDITDEHIERAVTAMRQTLASL